MTGTTSKTTNPAVARPMSATEMQQGALDAIPGHSETVTALSKVDARLAELHEPMPPPFDAAGLAALLLNGERLPDAIGEQLTRHTEQIASRHREVQLLGQVHDSIELKQKSVLRHKGDQAFGWLDGRLRELVEQGWEVLSRLGPGLRTAEAALNSTNPTKARDDLRALRELADAHESLRQAQIQLVGIVAAVNSHHLTWREQLDLVREHGLVSTDAAGSAPADPLARFVWVVDGPAAPAVPGYRELVRRANAIRPAAKPRPANNEGEPYLDAAGAGAQRLHRLQTRAVRPVS